METSWLDLASSNSNFVIGHNNPAVYVSGYSKSESETTVRRRRFVSSLPMAHAAEGLIRRMTESSASKEDLGTPVRGSIMRDRAFHDSSSSSSVPKGATHRQASLV